MLCDPPPANEAILPQARKGSYFFNRVGRSLPVTTGSFGSISASCAKQKTANSGLSQSTFPSPLRAIEAGLPVRPPYNLLVEHTAPPFFAPQAQ